jgi:hypothetical protein
MNYKYVKFKDAINLIEEADILLFRHDGPLSYLIKRASDGLYTHVGIASWVHNNKGDKTSLEMLEFREWRGGRAVELERQVKKYNKQIDVFRLSPVIETLEYYKDRNAVVKYTHRLFGDDITNCMRQKTGIVYGWPRIWWLMKHHMLFFRLFQDPLEFNDNLDDELVYPVCSTVIAHCIQQEYVDIMHHRANIRMEPSDIARSPFTNYLFTLEI